MKIQQLYKNKTRNGKLIEKSLPVFRSNPFRIINAGQRLIIHLSSLILSSFFYHFTFFIPIFLDFFLIFSIFFFKGPINSIELFIGINPCYSILFINFFSLFFYIFFIILFSFYYFLVLSLFQQLSHKFLYLLINS